MAGGGSVAAEAAAAARGGSKSPARSRPREIWPRSMPSTVCGASAKRQSITRFESHMASSERCADCSRNSAMIGTLAGTTSASAAHGCCARTASAP